MIYEGDLSEYPYAKEVKVTKSAEEAEEAEKQEAAKAEEKKKEEAKKAEEKKKEEAKKAEEKKKDEKKEAKKEEKKEAEKQEVKTGKVNGIVAEFTEKTMLLAIDSATSYRFSLQSDFKVSGADKYVHTGDSVNVTYKGDLGKTPEVLEINIVKKAQEEKRTVNGTISSVEKDYVTLNTGGRSYIIHTDKNTKYTGDKPAKGYKAEITYTGRLGSSAKASNIYCVKVSPDKKVIFTVVFTDGTCNVISTQTVEKGKAATAPKDPVREGYTFKGWDKDFSKITSDLTVSAVWKKNAAPSPEPEEEIVSEGTITVWTTDDENKFSMELEDGSEITLEAGDFTEIASGYFPAAGDRIKAT